MEEGIYLGAYPLITQKYQPLLIFFAEPRLWRTYLKRASFGVYGLSLPSILGLWCVQTVGNALV